MEASKKIVLVANDVGGVGGMEKHLQEMISRIKNDYELTVVASTMNIPDADNLRFIRVPTIRRPFPLMILMFSLYASLRIRMLRRQAIIHTTGAIVFCKADVSTVHFCHAGWQRTLPQEETDRYNGTFLRKLNGFISTHMKLWMERLCYNPKRTPWLIPVSQRVQHELTGFYAYPKSAVTVISNGVDTLRFCPAGEQAKRDLRSQCGLPEKGIYVVFVGGDWERKGVRFIIEAFNELADAYPELHVLIVGAGDVARFVSTLSSEHTARVHFVGKQPNPELWYRLSDIFVFPSNYEACSLAVLEAAASGLAMVVTNVGGAAEIIDDGWSGYFVERNADSIKNKLRFLLDNPAVIRRAGLRVRRKVESFTWDATYQQFAKLYETISREKREFEARYWRKQ